MNIDARGEACPIPVIRTKKAIREIQNEAKAERVSVLVDNIIATQNLTKMCVEMGLACATESLEPEHGNGGSDYIFTVDVVTDGMEIAQEFPVLTAKAKKASNLVVVSSDTMGQGNDELGAALMRSFIFALSESDTAPESMIFYNGGAKLTAEGSPVLNELRAIEQKGTELLTCGACLSFYGLSEKLCVGSVTNMYAIIEKMSAAERIIKP